MRIIFCTSLINQAESISKSLLNDNLIACVNVIPLVTSYYKWKGKICSEKEALLIIKTKVNLVQNVIKSIKKIHSYDTIEILSIKIEKESNRNYLKWIEEVTR